jgi:hypothetical protein
MYLQLDTKFNPFTYDEMVKPLLYYKQAYDSAEAAYSDLASQTEAWKSVANQENSPEAYAMYQRYSGDLNRLVDDFSRGMNSSNRRALLNMKRRYAKDIQPIADASKRRETLAEEQRKAELNNPTMLWQRKASDMSLDDFINNPSADYGKSYSGAALSAQVAASAGALAKEFRDNPDKMKKLVGGDYYEYIKQRGFTSEAVLAAIMDNPNASPVLTNLVESAIGSTGIKDWGSTDTINQAYNYARQGLWSAVGQDESQLVQNWRAQENLSHANAMARQNAAQKFQADEAEKQRNFQKEQMAPREIVDQNGNGTGTYYDPKLGIVTDKSGKVVQDKSGGIGKVGTSSTGAATKQEAKDKESFKKVSGVADMRKLGYSPVFVTGKFSGTWYSRKEGEDAPDTYSDYTRSNLVTNHIGFGTDGNITFTPRRKGAKDGGVTYVDPGPNNDFPSIPQDAKNSLSQQLSSMSLRDDQDIQIIKVRSERGDGSSGDDYDYIICVSN